jgi:hypothetical protein
MGFVMAALRNTRFLCGAIVVTAVIAMLSDLSSPKFTLHLLDIADLLLILLTVRYLQLAEPSQTRDCIQGLLSGMVVMLVIMYAVG